MFTDAQIQEAVEKFLLGNIAASQVKGGARDTTQAHADLLGYVASAFLLDPDAYWYVVWLAKNRARARVREALAQVELFRAAAASGGRAYRNIKSTGDLVSATVALQDLSTGLTVGRIRGAAPPALQRAQSALTRFVRQHLAVNVVSSSGEVLGTAQEGGDAASSALEALSEVQGNLLLECEALIDASTDVAAMHMPSYVATSLIERVQVRVTEITAALSSTTQASENSAAFLDLLAAKTLLGAITSFRSPTRTRTAVVDAAPSVCAPASFSISGGPWFLAPGTALGLEVNGVPVSIPLPSSRPVLSAASVDPTLLSPTDEVSISLDHGASTDFYAYAGPDLVDITAFTAATNAALPGVTAYVSGGTLYLRRENDAPSASIELTADTSARGAFADWFTGGTGCRGSVVVAYPSPVKAHVLAALLEASDPGVRAEESVEELSAFLTSTWAGTTFTDVACSGSLTSTGTVVTVPANLAAKLVVGEAFLISGIGYEITSKDGTSVLTTPAVPAGTHTFTAGTSFVGTPLGTPVLIAGSTGFSLWTYVTAVEGSSVTVQGPAWDWGETVRVALIQESVHVSLIDTSPGSSLEVLASSGASALGVTPALHTSEITQFTLDAGAGKAGDLLRLVAPSGVEYTREIVSVGATVEVEAVPYEAGTWSAQVLNGDYVAYEDLAAACAAYADSTAYTNFLALTGSAVRGSGLGVAVDAAATAYTAALTTLATALDAYLVNTSSAVQQVVALLSERGLDRGVDLFLNPGVSALLASSIDDLTYASWLARVAGDVTRQVAPARKTSRGPTGQVEAQGVGEYRAPFDPTRRR